MSADAGDTLGAQAAHAGAGVMAEAQMIQGAKVYLRANGRRRQFEGSAVQLAWQEFHGTFDPVIRRIVRAYRVRADNVEDCVQEVWAHLIQELSRFEYDPDRGRLHAWVRHLARNRLCALLRRQNGRPEVGLDDSQIIADVGDPAEDCQHQAELHNLRQLVSQLKDRVSPISYQVFYMRMMEGRSVLQVAWRLGLSQQQVWFRQHRVKKELCRLFHAQYGDGPSVPRQHSDHQGQT